MNNLNRSLDANRGPHNGTLGAPGLGTGRSSAVDDVSTTPTRNPMPHSPNTPELPDELESDKLPVEPDQGPIPTHIPEYPEHDRVVDPGEHESLASSAQRSTSQRQECAVSVIPIARHANDQKLDTPPTGAAVAAAPTDLALPHERDESTNDTAQAPDPMMVRAKRDIDAGLVDTDMHATPGLDAKRRAGMVPGAGGKPIRTDGSS